MRSHLSCGDNLSHIKTDWVNRGPLEAPGAAEWGLVLESRLETGEEIPSCLAHPQPLSWPTLSLSPGPPSASLLAHPQPLS
ncbi:hypothetical protein NHX12_002699 [Muraenolepis orangiensis]|uniref:Uncharacterized protein n=1 Tax=Muraenolepis orangiensis TaxID=630683 RepID=A0A9Q0IFH4_9TELE|nr:hypothetical protein NHX12_002699 [Muraenolepis orangiensis]